MLQQDKGSVLLTTEEVAARLQIEPKTLAWWRSQKRGPAFVRLGTGQKAPIRYRPASVEAYIEKMECAGAR